MADNEHLPGLLVTARPARNSEKRKTEAEKAATKSSGQNRVNIGTAFQRWRQLRELKGLRSDAMVALFLLDSYEKRTSTPWKPGLLRPPPPAGSAVPAESLSDHDGDLSVAPEHTFELLKKVAEYEEELRHLKEENERQQKLLDAAFNSEVRLHTAGVEQLMVRREEVPSEQQEGSSSLNHEDQTEPPHNKGEKLQDPEEAEIIKFTFFPVPVKTEEEDVVEEKPQSSQFQQTKLIRSEMNIQKQKLKERRVRDQTQLQTLIQTFIYSLFLMKRLYIPLIRMTVVIGMPVNLRKV
nr:uncharacterized protein LOC109989033 [Labrus bergylta]